MFTAEPNHAMNTPSLKSFCLACLILAATLPFAAAQPQSSAKPRPAADKEWWYHPHKDHTPSGAPEDIKFKDYHACFLGDTGHKVVYLTFDEGSETGNTPKILDTLKANGVHATFFATRFYMKEAPALVKRMVADGHVVANHSATHPSHLGARTDAQIQQEILEPAQYFKQLTGQEMVTMFRPPCGACDERILRASAALGWRTVFWSMAYEDYKPAQKGGKFAVQYVMKYHHPGAIILLHPYASNTTALDDIIKDLKAAGYQFGKLTDLQ